MISVVLKFNSHFILIRVVNYKLQMLTLSTERFEKIQKEAPEDCQKFLVQVTKYKAAKECKVLFIKNVSDISI